MFIDSITVYGNAQLILLLVFESVYIITAPFLDKDYELRKVFLMDRKRVIKKNYLLNAAYILILWILYISLCSVLIKSLHTSILGNIERLVDTSMKNELQSRLDATTHSAYGYILFILFAIIIYMLDNLMGEMKNDKKLFRVMYLVFYVSMPIVMVVSLMYQFPFDRYLPILGIFIGLSLIICSAVFIRFWLKGDIKG